MVPYPYYDGEARLILFDRMVDALNGAAAGDLVGRGQAGNAGADDPHAGAGPVFRKWKGMRHWQNTIPTPE